VKKETRERENKEEEGIKERWKNKRGIRERRKREEARG
jgi:hypothetical protein